VATQPSRLAAAAAEDASGERPEQMATEPKRRHRAYRLARDRHRCGARPREDVPCRELNWRRRQAEDRPQAEQHDVQRSASGAEAANVPERVDDVLQRGGEAEHRCWSEAVHRARGRTSSCSPSIG
jgi:hypothetical protein